MEEGETVDYMQYPTDGQDDQILCDDGDDVDGASYDNVPVIDEEPPTVRTRKSPVSKTPRSSATQKSPKTSKTKKCLKTSKTKKALKTSKTKKSPKTPKTPPDDRQLSNIVQNAYMKQDADTITFKNTNHKVFESAAATHKYSPMESLVKEAAKKKQADIQSKYLASDSEKSKLV